MGKKNKAEVKPGIGNPWEYAVLAVLAVGAFLIRTVGQWKYVFVGDQVWFRGVDAWYHMRLVDSMAVNFPQVINWDYYAIYPSGATPGYMPLLGWIIVVLGNFADYDHVAALLPPIMAAITIVFVYLIGKELFSGKVALLGCFLLAVLPGEFMHRSLLGFADHHALESLLMAASVFLLIKAYRTQGWKYILSAGFVLGLYMLASVGSVLFLIILGVWFWVEFLRCYRKGESVGYMAKLLSFPALIALAMSSRFLGMEVMIVLAMLAAVPALLVAVDRYVKNRETVLFALTILIPIILATVDALYKPMSEILFPIFWGGTTYIEEAQPILLKPAVAWYQYGLVLPAMLGGLWLCRKDKNTGLFVVWSAMLLVAVLGQMRWGYYASMSAALLASYLVFRLAEWVVPQAQKSAVAIATIVLVVTVVGNTMAITQRSLILFNQDWNNALVWMRENTPDPFNDGNAYYLTDAEQEANYGVLSWWDYGHWIIRIARRVPLTSPTRLGQVPARFFASKSIDEAESYIGDLNIKYVIVHREMLYGKWYAIPQRAGFGYYDVKESVLYQLCNGELENYELVAESGAVRIYERHTNER